MHKIFSIFLLLCLLPMHASAQPDVMRRFTKIISQVYSSSEACKDTLTPSPAEYSQLIGAYLKQ